MGPSKKGMLIKEQPVYWRRLHRPKLWISLQKTDCKVELHSLTPHLYAIRYVQFYMQFSV